MLEKTPSVAMRSCVWRTSLVRNGCPTASAMRRRTTLSRVTSRPRITMDRDDDLVALDDVEAHAGARVVGRGLERVLDVDVVVAELLVPIDDAPARVLELHGAHGVAERAPRAASATSFSLIVLTPVKATSQRRVRGPELHRDDELDLGRALDAAARGRRGSVNEAGAAAIGSGRPDGSYSHVSVDVCGSGSGTQRPGGPRGSHRARTIPIGPTSAWRNPSFL